MSERSIEDRMGEALRISRLGLIRPVWADLGEVKKAEWRQAAVFVISAMELRGLKVVVEEGDKTDG